MKTIIHKNCNGAAFKYDGPLYGTMRSELAYLKDGSHPDDGSKIKCENCNKEIKYPRDELEEIK